MLHQRQSAILQSFVKSSVPRGISPFSILPYFLQLRAGIPVCVVCPLPAGSSLTEIDGITRTPNNRIVLPQMTICVPCPPFPLLNLPPTVKGVLRRSSHLLLLASFQYSFSSTTSQMREMPLVMCHACMMSCSGCFRFLASFANFLLLLLEKRSRAGLRRNRAMLETVSQPLCASVLFLKRPRPQCPATGATGFRAPPTRYFKKICSPRDARIQVHRLGQNLEQIANVDVYHLKYDYFFICVRFTYRIQSVQSGR